MHKAGRPVINPQWVMLGVLGRGEEEGGGGGGHKKDPRAVEGGRHTRQSIVGHLTPGWVSTAPPFRLKTQAGVNNSKPRRDKC